MQSPRMQPFASTSAVRRSIALTRVARPHLHSNDSTYSYTDLVVSYQRLLPASEDIGRPAASQQYLSDPAVYGNPRIMAKQIQHTLGQVVSTGKAAVEEVASALDPQQHSHKNNSSSNTHHHSHRPKPLNLKAISKQAARLGQAITHDVHAATQDAYHRYGPHITAAGVRLVGKGTAAAAVDVIGPTNTARAIRQLGSTNAAAATEQLGVTGVLKVSKRLGPVGIAKVVAKLGPRGVLNLAAHIRCRTADSVRAHAAKLNPADHDQQQQADAAVDEVAARLQDEHYVSRSRSRSSSSSNRRSSSSRRQGKKLPGVQVAVVAAVLQLLLLALAGVLQSMSKLLQAGVRLWDRLHRRREEGVDADTKEPMDGSPSLPAAAPAGSS